MLMRGHLEPFDITLGKGKLSSVQGQPILPSGDGGNSLRVGRIIYLIASRLRLME